MKTTITYAMGLFKKEMWRHDPREQGWEYRTINLADGAVVIKESFNPGTKIRKFVTTYYTGNPRQYWESKDFPDLKQAVGFANSHMDDSAKMYQEFSKYGSMAHRVARRYIKKVAGFRFDPQDLPEIGARLVDIHLEGGGDLRQGDSVCVLAFDDTKEIRIFVGKDPVEKESKTACMMNDLAEVPPVGAVITRIDWDGDSIVELTADGKRMIIHVDPPDRQIQEESEEGYRAMVASRQRAAQQHTLRRFR